MGKLDMAHIFGLVEAIKNIPIPSHCTIWLKNGFPTMGYHNPQ